VLRAKKIINERSAKKTVTKDRNISHFLSLINQTKILNQWLQCNYCQFLY
jgi:hypothetical protein